MITPTAMQKVLVMRFSALGDVVLVVPVLKALLEDNPNLTLLMLSNKEYAVLFQGMERVQFIGVDLKKKHAGILGIVRIFNMVRKEFAFDLVADLHGVIRTQLLRFLFALIKKPGVAIDKGRLEKYALTRKENKVFRLLPHTTERYQAVFKQLGLHTPDNELTSEGLALHRLRTYTKASPASATGQHLSIGFAPFAKHATKMFNLDRFKKIIREFDRPPYRLYFFGGTVAEKLLISQWNTEFKQAAVVPASYSLNQELDLMRTLRVMVSMDSANMHLASLAGIPVVSIWGPTHPYTGFYGVNQDPLLAVQVNTLGCRPCSVFGGRPCWRGDHACMEQIAVADVVEKISSSM